MIHAPFFYCSHEPTTSTGSSSNRNSPQHSSGKYWDPNNSSSSGGGGGSAYGRGEIRNTTDVSYQKPVNSKLSTGSPIVSRAGSKMAEDKHHHQQNVSSPHQIRSSPANSISQMEKATLRVRIVDYQNLTAKRLNYRNLKTIIVELIEERNLTVKAEDYRNVKTVDVRI